MLLARDDEQERLRSLLQQVLAKDDGPDEGYLVVVHGLGGVGKTELHRRYTAMATGEHTGDEHFGEAFIVVALDYERHRERHRDDYLPTGPPLWRALDGIYAVLERSVAKQRSEAKVLERSFQTFRRLAREAADRLEQAAPVKDAAKSLDGALGDLAALLTLVNPQGAAVATGAKHLTSGMRNVIDAQRSARQGTVGSSDYEAVMRPDEALAAAFAEGVRELSRQTRPIVILLDTAELLGDARVGVFDAIRASGSRCVWVIATRFEQLSPGEDPVGDLYFHTLPSSRLRVVEPARFTTEDIAEFLAASLPDRVPDDLDLAAVARLTRGLPLAVRLFANLLQQGVPAADAVQEITGVGEVSNVVVQLAKRYLTHVAPPGGVPADADLPLILGLALLRGEDSDPDLLGALWDVDPSAVGATKSRLARYHDFVLPRSGSLHGDVKRAVQLFLLQPEHRVTVRSANRRAVEVLDDRRARVSPSTIADQVDSDDWRTTITALLWHTFWCDDREGLRLLDDVLLAAQVLRPSFARVLLQTADFFAPTFSEDSKLHLAGLHALFPTSPFLGRIGQVFRSEWEAGAGRGSDPIRVVRAGMAQAAAGAGSVLAPDIDPAALLVLIDLQMAEVDPSTDEATRVDAMVRADAALPVPGAVRGPIDVILARRAEELGRSLAFDRSDDPKRLGSARVAADIAVRRDPDGPAGWSLLEVLSDLAGDYESSLVAGEHLVRLRPEVANRHHNLAVTLHRLGRYDEAVAAYERAVALDPGDAARRRSLGSARSSAGDLEGALVDLRRAVELAPNDADIRRSLVQGLGMLARYDEALQASVAPDGAEDDPDLQSDIGLVLQHLGRHGDAARAYRRAVELEPGDPQRLEALGRALEAAGDLEAAIDTYRQALAADPTDVDRYSVLVRALTEVGLAEEAHQLAVVATGLDGADAFQYHDVGVTLQHLERHDEAIQAFARARDLEPQDPGRWSALGLAQAAAHREELALDSLHRALDLDGSHAPYHVNLATVLGRLGRFSDAASAYLRALELDPDEPVAHRGHVSSLALAGRAAEAFAAIAADPTINEDPDAHHNLGYALRGARDYDGAAIAFERAADLAPTDPARHLVVAEAAVEKGDPQAATAAIDRALALDPVAATTHRGAGMVLQRLERHDDALARFERAIELDPTDHRAHHALGNSLAMEGRLEEALGAYRGAVRLGGDDAVLLRNLGNAQQRLERTEEAVASFRRVVALDPASAAGHAFLAAALAELGDNAGALESYERAAELDDERAFLHFNAGVTLQRLGRDDDAVEAFRRAVDRDPENGGSHRTLGVALSRVGRFADAASSFERAIALDGADAVAQTSLALNLSRLGRHEDSIAAFDRAIELEPDEPIHRNNRAEALLLAGRLDEATEGLRATLALRPDHSSEAALLLGVLLHGVDPVESRSLLDRVMAGETDTVTEFRAGELRSIAHFLSGDLASAVAEVRSVAGTRGFQDVFQDALYEVILTRSGRPDDLALLVAAWPDGPSGPSGPPRGDAK